MFIIKSNFICNFKLGDNIIYNLEILSLLYMQYDNLDSQQKKLLLKPIIILLVSIIEAVLYDFHTRIRNNTSEGVANLASDVIDHIRGKKIDELEKYIASAKKHDFFDAASGNFYDKLDELRVVRNRIHIQNSKNYLEKHEANVFSTNRKILAEKVLEIILKQMNKKYYRDARLNLVGDFTLPWNEYYN